MKNTLQKIFQFSIILICFNTNIFSQDVTFTAVDTLKTDTLGAETIFLFHMTNTSAINQTVFLVRTKNLLPTDWQTSLCFDNCYAPGTDSIASTSDFQSTPLTPGETREASVHLFSTGAIGTAYIQVECGETRNPTIRTTFNLTAIITDPVSVKSEELNSVNYLLEQNYPNPFNPSTKISFSIPQREYVSLKVYDLMGRETLSLVNQELEKGNHHISFASDGLASGTYFYKLTTGNYTSVKKMLLLK